MIHLHAADDCLGLGFQAVFFVDGVHDLVAQVIGDDDGDDLFFGLEGDAVISLQRFYAAPSGPEDRAASCAQASGGLQYRFRITLIDADKDQGVFVFSDPQGGHTFASPISDL